ncbi:hypothetical protein B0J13DRAFT_544923 [Dactylonectria estremocensis]|uniref:Lea domain protein n=1 Tax=Dactylonectria estremocensis TaxID=1079267 RepID=A0A9P9JEG9_9HYPO|nr:hypothetical protein B0J13DRAFT_544923 [Dactylonectria estremocensis]
MSFLTENLVRNAGLVPRMFPRMIAIQAPRAFSTSFAYNRTAPEAIKDSLKTVDRAVSDKLVDGINASETVTQKVKEGVSDVTKGASDLAQGKRSGEAAELRGEAKGKASELQGKANEVQGKVKGAAEQAKGKVKGAVDEAQSKL